MSKLKPCPFCGSEAEVIRMGTGRVSMQIGCTDCGAFVESGEMFISDGSRWNARAFQDSLIIDINRLSPLVNIVSNQKQRIQQLEEQLAAAKAEIAELESGIEYAIDNFAYYTQKTGKLLSYKQQELEVKHLMDVLAKHKAD
ncbi:Lar family restriction alleviation protein [Photobacterium carnosum]|uniref:Lar family restriction alleviation protein n=1 Tax=Photobacterium carnosum TaxID=2023717 RepID=UPI001E2E1AE7|nr:Lar family restriction alleviation protein [Photobacterium carnosum]MCD9514029.1 hypothetical protein [Photobacterium carnosum]